ncbi:MAG: pilus assembly protein TadG-related protein [Desulfarculus sp.]|nr:pilus assembly protein TadG-related protein [Desulfarculus sp.]
MTRFINLTKLFRRLFGQDRGTVAPLTAVSLVALLGLTGAAVDLGALYSARGELQNAADASALAAANTMITYNSKNLAIAQPSVALTNAQNYSKANKSLGVALNLRQPPGDDFTIGFWDNQAGAFDPSRTGLGLTNPDDLTAVRVTVRRDELANTPVRTFFSGIVGVNQVGISASSTAFLGFAGSAPVGGVTLPIAVDENALKPQGGEPYCGKSITFHSENDENGSWTTFFDWPADSPTVDNYVCGCEDAPALKLGDMINITNGNLSNNIFTHLRDRFNHEKSGGQWTVTLPVYKSGGNSGAVEVVGFANMVITEVRTAPYKDVTGSLKCGTVVPQSVTGGDNFGARATLSRLVR